ncbi:AAA family ATPase, partial [Pseudoalteromonas sp. S4492]|uniref:helix-hairpin-helix domain-containing protein n=1 Tax=Pseudoalteromonas sp. S4492 TaxID=579560 RepID=UPI001273DA90
FDKHDIPSGIARTIIKFHKANAIEAIQQDPYRLISFGLKFSDADKLAIEKFGFNEDDYIRLSGAIEQALHTRMLDGHTVSKHGHLLPLIKSLLGSENLAV